MLKLKKPLVVFTFVIACASVSIMAHRSESASLSEVSVTLTNSRPSLRAGLASGNVADSSEVIIKNSLAANRTYPSGDANQLMPGDNVTAIGTTSNDFAVTDVISDSRFTIDDTLAAGHIAEDTLIISTQSAQLVVNFKAVNALVNGSFRVLVPGGTDAALHGQDGFGADGRPDGGFFDYGTPGDPTVTCDEGVGATGTYSWTPDASPRSYVDNGITYHEFICEYTGNSAIADEITITIDDLINPAPNIDANDAHVPGLADAYNIIVQHLNAADAVFDSTTVQIGVIEAVRVTASVAPQITFQITGINSNESACGQTTSVPTTATRVDLQELAIDDFTDAAQNLRVSTNAVGGYVVTLLATGQLGRNGDACVGGDSTDESKCIPHPVVGSMSTTTAANWTNTNQKGFAYSLENNDAASPVFTHGGGINFNARHFPDAADGDDPELIFESSTVADSEDVNLCYRAVISAIQAAGNYENYVTYTATAKF